MQFSLADLLERAGEWPKEKALRTQLRRVTLSPRQRRVMFLAVSSEPYSNPSGHVVSIFYPKAGRLDRWLTRERSTPLNQTCRVGCSCEAWSYWGAAYKSTQEGYRLPGPEWREDRVPGIRDPDGRYWICKHVIRVTESLQGVSFADLAVGGAIPTPQHAQASLDALHPVITPFLLHSGLAWDQIEPELSLLHPDDAEDVMARLGMLCAA